jgi:hypothetical protein
VANIALAIFANLGGVPWAVEAPASDDDPSFLADQWSAEHPSCPHQRPYGGGIPHEIGRNKY